VTENHEVQGCDVVVPAYEFQETHVFEAATVNDTYKAKLIRLTGTVNNAAFRGCAAGECLFVGANGGDRDDGKYEMTFSFSSKPNKTAQTVGGNITGVAYHGWDYVWIIYEATEDTTSKEMVQRPKWVYVEVVYEEDDFADLGIG